MRHRWQIADCGSQLENSVGVLFCELDVVWVALSLPKLGLIDNYTWLVEISARKPVQLMFLIP